MDSVCRIRIFHMKWGPLIKLMRKSQLLRIKVLYVTNNFDSADSLSQNREQGNSSLLEEKCKFKNLLVFSKCLLIETASFVQQINSTAQIHGRSSELLSDTLSTITQLSASRNMHCVSQLSFVKSCYGCKLL